MPLRPGRSLPVRVPLASTRSCVVVGSVFVRSITSRLPAGTVTESGMKRIPFASTRTVVVSPVAGTALPALVTGKPAAPGSAATPSATAMPRTANAATSCPLDQTDRAPAGCTGPRGVVGSPPPARTTLRERRIAMASKGRKQRYAASTSVVVSTRTMDGMGSRLRIRPALISASRVVPKRPSVSVAVRTAFGPPPRTTGTR